jgi:Xaa-Pro aminopeptidase
VDKVLKSKMVITVEPGIYIKGSFGVRIEDLIVVTKEGYKNLTSSTKEMLII